MTKFPFDVAGRWYFQYRARNVAQAQGDAKHNHDHQADIIQQVEFFVYNEKVSDYQNVQQIESITDLAGENQRR
jgi:hypothetical protein